MKYIYSIILLVCLISLTGISQPTYWWELKQSGSSLGGPIDVMKYDTDVVYYGSDNKIYKSVDRGESFAQTGINVPSALEIKCIILDDYNPGTFLIAIESSPDQILKTTDDGITWDTTMNNASFSFFGIPMSPDPSHPDTIYTMSTTNFYRSTDFGSTWTTIASNFGPSSAPCDIEVFPDTSIILIGDDGTGIFKSTDYGVTWEWRDTTFGEIPTIAVDFTNPGVAWATKWGGGGGLLKSTDYGENWDLQPGFTGTYMWGVHVQPTDGNLVIAGCYSCGSTWRSINGGATWTQISIPSTNYQIFIVDSITQFSAQGNGFYKLDSDLFIPVELTSFTAEASENEIILNWTTATELNNQGFEIQKLNPPLNPLPGGEQKGWVKIGFVPGFGTTTESKSYSYKIDEFAPGIQYYRLKQIDFDGTYEYSEVIEVEGITPGQFTLFQNYPNPFNPSTSIKFFIPVDSNVKLKLFNMLGQEVAELLNSEISAGIHHIDFNASRLSSGTYFYVLEANGNNGSNFTATKKMILLR